MFKLLVTFLRSLLLPRSALVLENLALRHQLAVLLRSARRPRLQPSDRIFWAWLSRIWSGWRTSLIIVKPETVYWSSEFETPQISRRCLTTVAISGPGVQLRPPTRSMLPDFEDEGALLPGRKSPQIYAKHVFKQLGAVQRRAGRPVSSTSTASVH